MIESAEREKELIFAQLKHHAEFDIRAVGNDSYDALLLSKKYNPDIILLNQENNLYKGIEVSHLVKRHSPNTAVVLMSGRFDSSMIRRCAESQASAFLLLEEDIDNLEFILRHVSEGKTWVNHRIGFSALKKLSDQQAIRLQRIKPYEKHKLTRNEILIMRLISQGCADKEIAERMRLKDGTVRNYISRLIRKTGLKNRAQIVRYAILNGFTETI